MAVKSNPGSKLCTVMMVRDNAPATRLFFHAMCLILVVYSDIAVRWRCCRADQGSKYLGEIESEQLVVSESCEDPSLEEITKVSHCQVKGWELTIKCTVFSFRGSELSAEES